MQSTGTSAISTMNGSQTPDPRLPRRQKSGLVKITPVTSNKIDEGEVGGEDLSDVLKNAIISVSYRENLKKDMKRMEERLTAIGKELEALTAVAPHTSYVDYLNGTTRKLQDKLKHKKQSLEASKRREKEHLGHANSALTQKAMPKCVISGLQEDVRSLKAQFHQHKPQNQRTDLATHMIESQRMQENALQELRDQIQNQKASFAGVLDTWKTKMNKRMETLESEHADQSTTVAHLNEESISHQSPPRENEEAFQHQLSKRLTGKMHLHEKSMDSFKENLEKRLEPIEDAVRKVDDTLSRLNMLTTSQKESQSRAEGCEKSIEMIKSDVSSALKNVSDIENRVEQARLALVDKTKQDNDQALGVRFEGLLAQLGELKSITHGNGHSVKSLDKRYNDLVSKSPWETRITEVSQRVDDVVEKNLEHEATRCQEFNQLSVLVSEASSRTERKVNGLSTDLGVVRTSVERSFERLNKLENRTSKHSSKLINLRGRLDQMTESASASQPQSQVRPQRSSQTLSSIAIPICDLPAERRMVKSSKKPRMSAGTPDFTSNITSNEKGVSSGGSDGDSVTIRPSAGKPRPTVIDLSKIDDEDDDIRTAEIDFGHWQKGNRNTSVSRSSLVESEPAKPKLKRSHDLRNVENSGSGDLSPARSPNPSRRKRRKRVKSTPNSTRDSS